jgi:hypothetical protein
MPRAAVNRLAGAEDAQNRWIWQLAPRLNQSAGHRSDSAIGCRKGTQGRQHLSLYVAHKLRRVADASAPVAERAWYLFPVPETLYCTPSPGKACWASLSSVLSATRVALFGG